VFRGPRLRAARPGVRRALLLEVSRRRVERSRGRISLGMLYESVDKPLSSSGNPFEFDGCLSSEKLIERARLPRSAFAWT
jgi:hypothetical protein